ncbi:MAG TPA: HAMP domain-containing histidine kinase [Epsilonproteobacteria bacterium]|nr:HAMP domain-containing histidine kinase [Campylobacterota bacterium]
MIELFLMFIFYHYYKIEEEHIHDNIFLEMKNYSLSFDDDRFDIDIIPRKKQALYELNQDDTSLYILVPFQDSKGDLLKIFYPKKHYNVLLEALQKNLSIQFALLSLIAMILAISAAFYTLKPIRSSLRLLEDFIKDIIHDLNTPLTSILINLKMIDTQNEEIESISRSAKNIAMLHQNLDSYLRENTIHSDTFVLKALMEEQVAFFAPLYDYLTWEVNLDTRTVITDKNAFTRIIYNLLSNACKYNTSHGKLSIYMKQDTLVIENDSYGIVQPHKVFERFYKESERGLGIGLHIVEKLCEELSLTKTFEVKGTLVRVSLDLEEVTSK